MPLEAMTTKVYVSKIDASFNTMLSLRTEKHYQFHSTTFLKSKIAYANQQCVFYKDANLRIFNKYFFMVA